MASGIEGFAGIEASFETNKRTDKPLSGPNFFSCESHSDTAAVKFCNDHESAVCLACANSHHRACQDIDDLEELGKKEMKGKRFKQFVSELDQVMQKVERLKRVKNEDLTKLRTETTDALNAIAEFRNDINWFLDKLERKGKMFIEKRYKEIHSDITDEVEQCAHTLSGLDKLKKRLENLEHKSQRFISTKLGKSTISAAQRLCKEMKEVRPRSEFVKMTIDPTVERLVMKLRWYGKHRTYLAMSTPPSLPHLYKVKHDSHFDIRCKADTKVCMIVGTCQITDGTILLIDSANQNVKQLDVTYKVVDYCELPSKPVAICKTTTDAAAVLLEEQTGFYVFTIKASSSSLTLCETFKIPERCTGLSFGDNQFYVCTDTTVSIYSTSGDYMHTIYQDASAELEHVHVSFHDEKLFVADARKGLIRMDISGDDIQVFNDSIVNELCCVCSDRCNQVFVGGHDSHNVLQLSQDLQKLGELVDNKKGLKNPLSVCYDFVSNRLIVTQKSRNFIKVYQLK